MANITKEKKESTDDPVSAIRSSLTSALKSLAGLIRRKNKALSDELEEVEKKQTGEFVQSNTGQINSQEDFDGKKTE